MPIIKSAIKKLRKDKKIAQRNRAAREDLRDSLKMVKANLKTATLTTAYSALDKAVKRGLIKAGKAARLKSRLTKAAKPDKTSSSAKKITKKKVAKT